MKKFVLFNFMVINMKKFVLFSFMVILCTALGFVSCDDVVVTDDKGVVDSVQSTYGYFNNNGKKYHVVVKIQNKRGVYEYELYTNKSYRVGDSIFIK